MTAAQAQQTSEGALGERSDVEYVNPQLEAKARQLWKIPTTSLRFFEYKHQTQDSEYPGIGNGQQLQNTLKGKPQPLTGDQSCHKSLLSTSFQMKVRYGECYAV